MPEHRAEKETSAPSGPPPGGEGLFRRLMEFAGQGIGWANLDGSVAYMNPTLRRMVELQPDEDVSRYGMSRFYRPQDLDGVVRDMLATAREQGSWSGEVLLVSIRGRTMPTLHDIHLIRDEAGAPLAFACVITDLTRLKESEATLRAIYEHAQEGILVASAATRRFLMANPAMCRMLGYSEAELLALSPEQLHPPAALPRVRAIFQAMDQDQFQLVQELPMRRKDGSVFFGDVSPARVEFAAQPAFLGIYRDVTEQKSAQAALRQERTFTNAILDNAGALVVVLDRDGRIRRFNRAAEELTRYSFAEVEGRCVWDFLLLPEERASVKQEAFQALAEHPERLASKYTNYWLARGGERRLIEWRNTVLLDSLGAMEHMVSIGIDVTEQRMVEAALRRSEETYARAEAIAHIGSWDWDISTGGLRWTNEVYRIFGRTPKAFAVTYQAFLDTVHPDDRQRVVDAVNASVAQDDVPYSVEHRVVRPSGEVRIVHERGKVYRDAEGRAVRMIGTVHDITERKQAEDELRRAYGEHQAVTQAIRDNLYMLNDKGRIVWWNREVEASTGLAPEALAAMYGPDFFVPEDRARVEAAMFKAAQVCYAEVEARFITTRGPVYYQFNGMPVLDENGRFLGIAGAGRDISDRKQAEEGLMRLNEELEARVAQRTAELSAAKEEAERANRSKSEFLSRMSHELHTPLNAILGFGQLLENDPAHPLHETQREGVREILHGGRHLLELINEVLDLARVESGHLTVTLAPLEIKSVLQECLSLVAPLAETHGIRLLDETPPACGSVLADRVRLKQVLLNLLSNAVKYNRPQGSVHVTCAREDGALQIAVRDTGDGLTQAQQNLLFRPFERLGADKAAIEGTGIGLALSKRLTEAMGGAIGVDSAPGEGSTFWLSFQATLAPACDAAADADEPASGGAAGQARILYIEDNPANMRLMERILGKREGVQLLTASHPGIGLELAAAHRPDLILLDINLPDMDGFEVFSRLQGQAETRPIPVIGISANAMAKDVERARSAGFTDYLTKPLEIPRLLGAIDSALAARPRQEGGA